MKRNNDDNDNDVYDDNNNNNRITKKHKTDNRDVRDGCILTKREHASYLYNMYNNMYHTIVDRLLGNEGIILPSYVFPPNVGIHYNTTVLDFASLYPTIDSLGAQIRFNKLLNIIQNKSLKTDNNNTELSETSDLPELEDDLEDDL